MKFSDYLIGNQWGQPMSIQVQTPIQPQQMQSIAPQQGMQSSVTDFWIKPNQSAPKKKAETFDVLWMLEKTNQFTQQAIKDNPAPVKREYSGRDKNIIEVKKWIEDSLRETHKLNTLLDMKKYVDDWATFEEVQQDFQDIPQEVIWQIYDELANKSKLSTILKMYPELDNIQPPKELSDKYSLQKDNALKQAGQFILDAKERSKEKWDISSNFLTQWFMWAVWGAVKWVWDLIQWWWWLVDKWIAWTQALIQWWEMEDYQALPNSTAEDLLDTASWVTSSLWALYAMPASILINSWIEALPEEWQRALSDSMDWLGDKIAKVPWLAQWMQSLPPERQSQFKQELAWAGVALLIGLKNKKNIITDPKTFLRENINPVAIAKNFNENVLWVPKAAGKLVEWAVNEAWNKISTTVKWAKWKLSTMTKWVKRLLPTAENTLQRMNRLTKSEQEKFKVMAWKDVWEWLNERWVVWDPAETITNLSDRFTNTKKQVDEWLSEIKGNYKTEALDMMLDDSIRFADNTRDTNLNRLKELQTKNKEVGLDMSEINEVKRFFERNNKFSYGRDMTAGEKTARATNIDNEVRNRQMNIAEENGFTNLRELNKEVQASKYIMDKLEKNESWRLGNNAITITDWIVAAPAMVDPTFLSLLVWKKLFNSNWFAKQYVNVINRLNWHTNIADKVADLVQIKKIQNEKDLNKFLALPYKWELWEKPNTIILPWKEIVTTPWGNLKKWGILEINSKKNDTSNTNNNSNISNIKNSWQVKDKWLSNLKDQWDMPKLPPKTPKELPAKQKIADTPLSNLKNPKKSVKSDNLVSKSDSMSKDLQPLYDEARKYKSADEFIDSKYFRERDISRYSDELAYAKRDWDKQRIESWKERINNFKKWVPQREITVQIENKQFTINSVPNKKDIVSKAKNKYLEIFGNYPAFESVLVKSDLKNNPMYKTRDQLRKIREEANKKWLKKAK